MGRKKKAAETLVDLSNLVDLREITAVRRSMDRRQGGDRFPIADCLELSCRISALREEKWVKAELLETSETGCAVQVPARHLRGLRPEEGLRLRIRFKGEFALSVSLVVIRQEVKKEKGRELAWIGCRVDDRDPGCVPFRDLVRFVDSLSALQGQLRLKRLTVREG